MTWVNQKPANIALIKYMGKAEQNIPLNASLSFTLNNLVTTVELSIHDGDEDVWSFLEKDNHYPIQLSSKGKARFLKHLDLLKKTFGYQGFFHVRSGNNFPSDCGLASSASSFAALTACAHQALTSLTKQPSLPINEIATLSRLGSGSSCRSFYSPWTLWEGTEVKPVELPYETLLHAVVLCNEAKKSVSSSEAHQRIESSLLFHNRAERAEERLRCLLNALENGHWKNATQIVWQEFWDMHALFHTVGSPFSYMNGKTLDALSYFESQLGSDNTPLVTMDAGANIHLLYRPDQLPLLKAHKERFTMITMDIP